MDPSTYTATIYFEDQTGVVEDVPWATEARSTVTSAGQIHVPEIGSYCCVCVDLDDGHAEAYIKSYAPVQGKEFLYPTWPVLEASEGGSFSLAKYGDQTFANGRPRNSLPGDSAYLGPGGEAVGVFKGGIALLKASELAQIIACQEDDLLRVIGRNYERLSDSSQEVEQNLSGNLGASKDSALLEQESRKGLFRLRVSSGKSAGWTNSSDPSDDRSEAMYSVRLNKVVGESEVPVADLIFGQEGEVQLRAAGEIKSEVIRIPENGGSIPRAPFSDKDGVSDLLESAKDHTKLITSIDNSDTLVASLEVPDSALEISDFLGEQVYAGTTVELVAEVIEEFSVDNRITHTTLVQYRQVCNPTLLIR